MFFKNVIQCIWQTSNNVFTESNVVNRHQALVWSQKNILSVGKTFFTLVFFVVCGEKRKTK